jgi:hypothetical protein
MNASTKVKLGDGDRLALAFTALAILRLQTPKVQTFRA